MSFLFQLVPILRTLYHAPDSNSHHIYMSLIVILILSEDDLFTKTVHDVVSSLFFIVVFVVCLFFVQFF